MDKYKFKIGDCIRVINKGYIQRGQIGFIVNRFSSNMYQLKMRDSNRLDETFTFNENDLQLVNDEYHQINFSNLYAVLKYNNIDVDNFNINYIRIFIKNNNQKIKIWFSNDNWLEHLELQVGKLKAIPLSFSLEELN